MPRNKIVTLILLLSLYSSAGHVKDRSLTFAVFPDGARVKKVAVLDKSKVGKICDEEVYNLERNIGGSLLMNCKEIFKVYNTKNLLDYLLEWEKKSGYQEKEKEKYLSNPTEDITTIWKNKDLVTKKIEQHFSTFFVGITEKGVVFWRIDNEQQNRPEFCSARFAEVPLYSCIADPFEEDMGILITVPGEYVKKRGINDEKLTLSGNVLRYIRQYIKKEDGIEKRDCEEFSRIYTKFNNNPPLFNEDYKLLTSAKKCAYYFKKKEGQEGIVTKLNNFAAKFLFRENRRVVKWVK